MGITITKMQILQKVKLKSVFTSLNDLFLKMIDIIMFFAPIGVFFLILKTFMTQGFSTILELASYFFTVLLVLIIHFFLTYGSLLFLLTKIRLVYFYSKMKNAILFAFSTASSAATIPVTLKTVEEELKVEKSVASFSVPLGATINMDGTSLYQAIAAVFIAQAFGIDLSISQQITIVLTATLASIGAAAVPGAGLVMLIIVLESIGVNPEGVSLIFAVDRILDMLRTVVNVTGDATIAKIIDTKINDLN